MAEPSEFQRLIAGRRAELRLTLGEVQRRSGLRADGRPCVYKQTASRLERQGIALEPDQETVEGLARALDLHPSVIWTAVQRTLGRRSVSNSPFRDVAIAHLAYRLDQLADPEERGHIMGTLRRLLDAAEVLEMDAEAEAEADALSAEVDSPTHILLQRHGRAAMKFFEALVNSGDETFHAAQDAVFGHEGPA